MKPAFLKVGTILQSFGDIYLHIDSRFYPYATINLIGNYPILNETRISRLYLNPKVM